MGILYIYNDWIWKKIKREGDNSAPQDYHTPEITASKTANRAYLHRGYPIHSKLSLKHRSHSRDIGHSLWCVTTVSTSKYQPKKHTKMGHQTIPIVARSGGCLKPTKIRTTFKIFRTRSKKLLNTISIKSKRIRNRRSSWRTKSKRCLQILTILERRANPLLRLLKIRG